MKSRAEKLSPERWKAIKAMQGPKAYWFWPGAKGTYRKSPVYSPDK